MTALPPHTPIKVFDGHNDLLCKLWMRGDKGAQAFLNPSAPNSPSITSQNAKEGGLKAGLFAVFVPNEVALKNTRKSAQKDATEGATLAALDMIDIAHNLDCAHRDKFRICRTIDEIDRAVAEQTLACILHLEGAEPINSSLDHLALFYDQGVRSIGPLWSRPNDFGEGVPLAFPGSPDQGGGLSDAGKALVAGCDEMGIMLDVSHLNEAGFWDMARLSSQPLTATHSNAYALCRSPRNLTDQQLAAIKQSGGMVGACFASAYLREDGQRNPDTEIDLILRHLDYLISHLGEAHVGLGSDFDGAVLPKTLNDCTGLPHLIAAMHDYGFGANLINQLCYGNWHKRMTTLLD